MYKFVRGGVIKDHQLDSQEFGKRFFVLFSIRKMFT